MKKQQNTSEIEIFASNETALSTKDAVDRRKIDVSIRKVTYIIA